MAFPSPNIIPLKNAVPAFGEKNSFSTPVLHEYVVFIVKTVIAMSVDVLLWSHSGASPEAAPACARVKV